MPTLLRCPSAFREALRALLFGRFRIPQGKFVLGLMLPLYLTGLSTGLVRSRGCVDSGDAVHFSKCHNINHFPEAPERRWI